jgi:acyl-CoA carboxylase epsilon subunit
MTTPDPRTARTQQSSAPAESGGTATSGPGSEAGSGGPPESGGAAKTAGPAECGGAARKGGAAGGAPAAGPLLRVVAGRPSDEDLAALTVVAALLAARSGAPRQPRPGRGWGGRPAMMRAPLNRDLGWRRSTHPR